MSLLIGAVFSGEARDLASDGAGVVRHDSGRIVFVPGLWRGERARIEVTELRGRIARGRLLELEQASSHRRGSPCPHHGFGSGDCGGCPWMFVDEAAQVAAKADRVEQALGRLGIDVACLRPVQPSPAPLGYRRRAQLRTDGERIGFVSASSRRLAPIDDCMVLSAPNRRLLAELRSQLPCKAWAQAARRGLATLDIDETTTAEQVRVNQRLPFAQANAAQNDFMRHWLAACLAGSGGQRSALELFCGSGNFTSVLVESGCQQVLAADVNAESTRELRAAGWSGVEVTECDLSDANALQRLATRAADCDLLLLDPPRDGMPALGRLLRGMSALREVLYVSCDLATWQRDAGALLDAGFTLRELQPVDAFPQTPHIELLSCFGRP